MAPVLIHWQPLSLAASIAQALTVVKRTGRSLIRGFEFKSFTRWVKIYERIHGLGYLAAALAEWPDEDLAYAMRADPTRVWQLRLCGYPRADRWDRETQLL